MDKTLNVPINNDSYGPGFGNSLVSYFKNYFNFTGRSTRSEYWWMKIWEVLYNILISGLAVGKIIETGAGITTPFSLFGTMSIFTIITIVVMFPMVTLTVRRMNDAGFPLWFNLIVVLVFYVLESYSQSIGNTVWSLVGLVLGLIIFIVSLLGSDDYKRF